MKGSLYSRLLPRPIDPVPSTAITTDSHTRIAATRALDSHHTHGRQGGHLRRGARRYELPCTGCRQPQQAHVLGTPSGHAAVCLACVSCAPVTSGYMAHDTSASAIFWRSSSCRGHDGRARTRRSRLCATSLACVSSEQCRSGCGTAGGVAHERWTEPTSGDEKSRIRHAFSASCECNTSGTDSTDFK